MRLAADAAEMMPANNPLESFSLRTSGYINRITLCEHGIDTYFLTELPKLDDPSVPELLVTEPGMGYRFVVPT